MLKSKFVRYVYVLLIFLSMILVCFGVLLFSPLGKIKNIDIQCNKIISQETILETAQIPIQTPLLLINTERIAKSLYRIPWLKSVIITKKYPSTIVFNVQERKPVAFIKLRETNWLVDETGVIFTPIKITSYPEIVSTELKDKDFNINNDIQKHINSGVEILKTMKRSLNVNVLKIIVNQAGFFEIKLSKNRTIEWGESIDNKFKVETLKIMLSQPGSVYNVFNYNLPTIRS